LDLLDPARAVARAAAGLMSWHPPHGFGLRGVSAALELFHSAAASRHRPPFGIDHVTVGGEAVPVREQAVLATPLCTLLRFLKEGVGEQPRILVVAPMSGHFATLLRGAVRTLLPDLDVYITDWHNVRDVPAAEGAFWLDDYIDHVLRCLIALGPDCHVLAVCQPAVPVLAATALMAEEDHRCQPRSMTLMAAPIDTRINPTEVNVKATRHSLSWFERRTIATVPARYPGRFRRVYPGFLQLSAFMAMNPGRHVRAHVDQYANLVKGDGDGAAAHRRFYDEYLAVMDLPAEFYLQTLASVFQRHDLPLGRMAWRGRRIDPAAIRRTTLFTVEGELDDICGVGQTRVAHALCSSLPAAMKVHNEQKGVGHCGVFHGRRWSNETYPKLRAVIG